ncbi:phage tail tape measure protein [Limosilactobacillus reuteri]|uniref:phage tail tape measure protein n=1 Tax=Limosilactobacillus reuteri TaxID=1598 RepID=UPI00128BA31C|nr:phage tail tape measure protein [Limosilactobacillus reuteri]MQB77296.1 phage tail tape measure protein [Limosilactobacillus reuteri]MQB99298.1 phage tail tape measure protein [Limosilactobacillus reuteri]
MTQSLGHLAATVSLDINPFKAANGVLKAQIKSTANALRAQEAALKASGGSINNMRAAYATMSQQMRNYNAQLQNAKKAMDDTTRSEQSRAKAATQYNKTSAQIEQLRGRMQALNRDIELQSNKWTQLANRTQHFGNVATSVGSKVSGLGRGMSEYLTLPIAAGLTYSAKKLVDFQDQMLKTKNVIRTSGESAAETNYAYKKMTADARKYSDEYGVSQQKIAAGYQDLVKRGYTSKAAIGVMRNELKASVATGDDFNDVINVASQTMESFGLATDKAGRPIKNAAVMQRRSTKTLNELAYAADATSTDFQSLGVGMSYVGSTAHQAGFSLSETASAMGILSNNGLEADKAGTGLRKVINSLVTPTANGQKALASINLSTKDFLDKNGKLKSMSSIFKTLGDHMKGMTGKQKNDIFHALFGTTGQQAGAILTENANHLRELNKEVQNSAKRDYIGDLAQKNLKSPKVQLAIFKESLTNAGMDMAKYVLPAVIPLVQNISKLAHGFGDLSPAVQKAIVATTLFTAGAGPLFLILGKLTSGVGKTALGFMKFNAGIGRAVSAARLGASGLDVIGSAFSKSTFQAAKFGTTMTGAGGRAVQAANGVGAATVALQGTGVAAGEAGAATAAAGVSLGTVAAVAGVATLAIAGGITVWELWGKKAVEASSRSSKWGSDVGAAADKALSKMQSTSQGIQVALSDMEAASHTSTKKMAEDFDSEFSQMESSAKKHLENIKESEKGLTPEVKAAIDKEVNNEKDQYNSALKDADSANQRAQKILSTTNKKVSDLSSEQRIMLHNNQQQMLNDEMKILKVSGNKRAKAMAVLNNNVSQMSARQRNARIADLQKETAQMQDEYDKQAHTIRKRYKGSENASARKAALNANSKALKDYTDKAAAEYIRLARANGQSTEEIRRNMNAAGLSYNEGLKQMKRDSKNAINDLKGLTLSLDGLKGKTKDAAKMWNDLVFDPKTGKVRTNAQEEVNKAVNSKDKWNKIQYLAKHLKLSSNAGKMVAAALIENGKWNKMSWDQKRLYVQDKATQNVLKALEKSGEWNNLDLQTKEAIVKAKGKQEMADILLESGAWNSLSLKQQEAVITNKATKPIYEALQSSGQWNNLTLKQQEAIIDAKGTSQLVDALVQANQWNNLTFKQQQALVTTKGTTDVMDALNKIGRWNQLSPKQEAIVNAKGSGQLGELISKYNLWKGMPASAVKQIIAEDRASGNLRAANDAILAWQRANPGAPKNALAIDNASGPMRNATGGVNVFANSNPGSPKNAQGIDSASGPMYSARNGVNAFAGSNTGPAKIAKANDKASGPIKTALDAIHNFMSIPNTIEKTVNVIFHKSKHAQGTNYHKGGLMEVNDQPGPVFRELVQFPGETPFIPYGRNVVFPAPRGTKVVKASDTAKMFKHLPQYANVSVLTNFKPNMQSTQVVNNYNNGGQSNNGMQKEMLDRMDQMLNRFGTMLGLNAAQLSAIKAGAFDKNQFYGIEGTDQALFDNQHL